MRTVPGEQLQTAFHLLALFGIGVVILWAGQVVLIPVAFAVIAAFLLWQAVR